MAVVIVVEVVAVVVWEGHLKYLRARSTVDRGDHYHAPRNRVSQADTAMATLLFIIPRPLTFEVPQESKRKTAAQKSLTDLP